MPATSHQRPATPKWWNQIPKVELHVHLEGSVTAAALRRLARRYNSDLAQLSDKQLRRRVYCFSDFHAFLQSFKIVCQHLRSAADYVTAYRSLCRRLVAQNVRYAEVLWTPSVARRNGLEPAEVFEALAAASAAVRSRLGLKTNFIFDCVRQWGAAEALATAQLAARYRLEGAVAFSVGGDELALAAGELSEVFREARRADLHVQAHAGEIGSAQSIWDALRFWEIERISHGCHAVDDPALLRHLADQAIPIDICLTSNLATGAVQRLADHPLPVFWLQGLNVAVSTDDPGLFQTTLLREYQRAARLCRLQPADIVRLVLNGVQASYMDAAQKEQLAAEIHTKAGF